MSWRDYYEKRLMTADDAIKNLIKPGNTVGIAHACAEPAELVRALVANHEAYKEKRIETVHMVGMGKSEYCTPEMEPYFHHTALFSGAKERQAINDARADLVPVFFHEKPPMFEGELPIDVALLTVCPPDKHGYCSVGVSVDYGLSLAKNAKTVIVQVNAKSPRTLGESFLHVTDIDAFVEFDQNLHYLNPPTITDIEAAIGKNCAQLIKDGDTLQLGIGSLPDAVLKCLTDKNDLGIHSEMISVGCMDLMVSGNINNKKKTLHNGKTVITFLMGTQELYDYVDDNPGIYMAPVNYVNDPYVVRQNDNMVAINACIQVDLYGQVCSEGVGTRVISGVGGQVDFVRGANMSKGGRAIIAMPSTAKGGEVSKIVPFLDQGARATTGHHDVNYIVTEYGVAQLRHQTYKERARRLIRIAHPNFRPQLMEEFERRFKEKCVLD